MERYSLISLRSLAFAPFVTYTQFSLLLSFPTPIPVQTCAQPTWVSAPLGPPGRHLWDKKT